MTRNWNCLKPFDSFENNECRADRNTDDNTMIANACGMVSQMNINIHPVKLAMSVGGTIGIIEMLVIRFLMVFTLFDMMDAKHPLFG